MKFRTLAAAVAAVSLAATPAIAEATFDRAAAPVESESEIGEGSSGTIIAIVAGVAIIAGIIIAADDDDDDPVSA